MANSSPYRERIGFNDYEMERLVKMTGLSKLELTGVIAAMNTFTYSAEDIKRWEHDEMMGRHVC